MSYKSLTNLQKLYQKKNPGGMAKNVTITAIIALKKGLVASGAHANHLSAYQLIIKGCPEVFGLPDHTSDKDLAQIVGKVVSNLPHHLPPCPPHDELFEANNYFILKDLKSCHIETTKGLQALDIVLDRMEEDNDMQDYVIRQVTSHHDYDSILNELDGDESDWERIRGVQMQIVRSFAKICRSRFIARYPTAFLFADIDEQLIHEIDVSDLISSSNSSGSDEWDAVDNRDDWEDDVASGDGWDQGPDRGWGSVSGGDEGSGSGEWDTAGTPGNWDNGGISDDWSQDSG